MPHATEQEGRLFDERSERWHGAALLMFFMYITVSWRRPSVHSRQAHEQSNEWRSYRADSLAMSCPWWTLRLKLIYKNNSRSYTFPRRRRTVALPTV